MGYVCKMCGKLLPFSEGKSICECEYCGSRQTVPKLYRDKYAEIYNRACGLRIKTDFEGAEKLFAQLCGEFPDEPEGYWGKVLCRCGILYEDEPVSGMKLPVCHRAYGTSLTDDRDCCTALSLADAEQCAVYRREASAIEMLRREMLERVGTGVKYDVFICCRIIVDNGSISDDRIIADEIYGQLVKEGLRVFYAPVTLGEMTENDSESYINAAVGCAPVLIIVSAASESFTAPRFKGEWGRCAAAAIKDEGKLIVTCIKNTDTGDVPAELSEYDIMQAAEMSFLAELIRKVKQHVKGGGDESSEVSSASPEKLIRRMNIFLTDEDFEAAEEYSDMILDASPRCWQAHFAKFLSYNGCRSGNDLLLEDVVNSFADDYIARFGYDFADDDIFREQFSNMLGSSIQKAVEYAEGDDKLRISTVYERFISAVRDAVFAREQEKIDGEEKHELEELRRRHERQEQERLAAERKRLLIRNRFLTYVGVIVGVLFILAIKFSSKIAAVLIVILVILTLVVMSGLGHKKRKLP